MKIGMVSDTFLPSIGGAEIHIYRLSCALRDFGYNIKIFTKTEGEINVNGFEVIRGGPSTFVRFRTLNDAINLKKFIKKLDIIHCHYTFYLSSVTCTLAKTMRKPSIVTLHGLGTLDSSVGNSLHMRAYRLASFKFANAIIATSNEMAELAERFTDRNKIYMIPNAVDSEFFKESSDQNLKKDKLIVLSIRRLGSKNGVQYLVEAIPYIVKGFGNEIEFWIAGRKKLEHYLMKRVKELDIENYVKFIGEIPNEKTKEYYDLSDIVVFPSSAESTSIACLEAMSMKKAIVASSLKAYKDLLGNNERGLLVKLFDRDHSDYNAPLTLPEDKLEALANAVLTLAHDEKIRKKFGELSRKHIVDNYDWKIIAKRIISVYNEVHSTSG